VRLAHITTEGQCEQNGVRYRLLPRSIAVAESAAAVQRAQGGMVRVRVQGVQVRKEKARRQRKAHRQSLERA
jgi:hypothetical protein